MRSSPVSTVAASSVPPVALTFWSPSPGFVTMITLLRPHVPDGDQSGQQLRRRSMNRRATPRSSADHLRSRRSPGCRASRTAARAPSVDGSALVSPVTNECTHNMGGWPIAAQTPDSGHPATAQRARLRRPRADGWSAAQALSGERRPRGNRAIRPRRALLASATLPTSAARDDANTTDDAVASPPVVPVGIVMASSMSRMASAMSCRRFCGSLRRHRSKQRRERRRCLARQRGPVRLPFEDAGERIGDRRCLERAASRQHLEQHTPERPDVRALVDRQAARLLGAHVGRRAENASVRGAAERA